MLHSAFYGMLGINGLSDFLKTGLKIVVCSLPLLSIHFVLSSLMNIAFLYYFRLMRFLRVNQGWAMLSKRDTIDAS